MILTVTLNTAVDLTYHVPTLRRHTTHRVTETQDRPGGKGVNVARVLARLGHPTTVTGFAGGPTGAWLREALSGEPHLKDALVPIGGTTRRTVAVVDAAGGDTTQFNEPGPTVTAAEWEALKKAYASSCPAPRRSPSAAASRPACPSAPTPT